MNEIFRENCRLKQTDLKQPSKPFDFTNDFTLSNPAGGKLFCFLASMALTTLTGCQSVSLTPSWSNEMSSSVSGYGRSMFEKKDLEYDPEQVREYVTHADLSNLRQGLSEGQVFKRLGKPKSIYKPPNDPDSSTYEYTLRSLKTELGVTKTILVPLTIEMNKGKMVRYQLAYPAGE